MSRPSHAGMVLLFASVVLLATGADQYGLLRGALERSTLWSQLSLIILRDMTWTSCVLIGGVCANANAPANSAGRRTKSYAGLEARFHKALPCLLAVDRDSDSVRAAPVRTESV